MATKTEAAIEVQDLHYTYQGQKKKSRDKKEKPVVPETLKGLSFSAPVGKITGLLGPNGSGKSTTFKIISTQLKAHSGDVLIFGKSATKEASAARQFLGVTFQSPSLDPWLSVRENLEIQASLFNLSSSEAKARIAELVQAFQLGEKFEDRVQTLSGGWARRVELAKAILHKPKILLLDEPTTGLDPLAKKNFWEELKKLRSQGVSILVTTHLMDEAEICDELVFISEGKLAAVGQPDSLRQSLGADIVWLSMENAEKNTELAVQKIQKAFPEAKIKKEDNRLRVETTKALELFDFSRNEFKTELTSLSWSKPDLADVYFSKTGKNFYDEMSAGGA